MATKAKLITKVDVKGTLLNIKPGESVIFKTKDIKANNIRSIARYLNQEGYLFKPTEVGLIDEMKVTRIK
ncbi:hypothetical protein M2459_001383 [Parabacteroides sp. PF5-5]|uniref:hypothetical protein n=1 Tax=unclassified Parabacteroides TaxID=2649774 RepID=UPI00247350F4|nr:MULTISPECIES: hypothetical protein [unclassified Parabacteroides]MDH6304647.1 hypothetical protein [Parabacteroides sp. PH5-39]MDH6315739.1 hypothetical protein [Parabacteroides sp. PF5-13]MDH6319399.1 hypothetical protein [Parabacteroides sp. PH5-13]MDH6323130.1 hypothetical protein [Parabacteroides sp. PH5-8]MDH6326932.1 hypothetical protein [Parabacteroides sp. PH5-41]